jgi:hypothetical protein
MGLFGLLTSVVLGLGAFAIVNLSAVRLPTGFHLPAAAKRPCRLGCFADIAISLVLLVE